MLTTVKYLAIFASAFLWTFIGCDIRESHAADCGAAERIQAQADLTAGANLLASPDPVRSLFGLRLMQAAAERRDAAAALCAPTGDAPERWAGELAEEDFFGPELPAGIDLDEAAAVLGVEPEAVATALAELNRDNPFEE